MKTVLIIVTLVAFTASEPPPSKSYLPPPSARSGYPQGPQGGPAFDAGVPEIVAARSLDRQERGGNAFARNGVQTHGGRTRFGGGGHDQHSGSFGRNVAEDEVDTVSYEAENSSYKTRASYQDTEDITRSGYDSNASNVRSNGNHDNGFPTGRGNHGTRSNGY